MLSGPASTRVRARQLRRAMSLPEVLLWQGLRRQSGLHFRRQHPAGPYVLDFFCAARLLAVEVDGHVHSVAVQAAHDARRDAWLASHGIAVLRLAAAAVLADPAAAAGQVVATALARPDVRREG